MKSIWIDCEWFIGGELFILGYCYNSKNMGQLYGHSLTKYRVQKILSDVKYIYCYGPDIGIIEKHFDMDLRNKYVCINLLKVFRHFIGTESYKLADLEKLYGIKRRRVEYKKNILTSSLTGQMIIAKEGSSNTTVRILIILCVSGK